MSKYDHPRIALYREQGETWPAIARLTGAPSGNAVRMAHARWHEHVWNYPDQGATGERPETEERHLEFDSEGPGFLPLEELLLQYNVDPETWTVRNYWVKGKHHSIHLVRDREADERRALELFFEELVADAAEHAPRYDQLPTPPELTRRDDPALFELVVNDPHLGMLAWGRETGEPYDLEIAVSDYGAAVEHLLSYAVLYGPERILYVVGNDFLHADTVGQGMKGGATARGTPQDMDTRLAKIFTAGRRALVEGIDRARRVAPVDVLVVPGNHDPEQMYRMGEVLSAWYRHDERVEVIYSANKRKYYAPRDRESGALMGYRLALMFTHGEEYKRQRESLPLVFADEAPAELWVASEGGTREIHVGHWHKKMQGLYVPTAEVDESRAIRTRALPGLTAVDAWHHEEGYRHRRTATALVYRRSGLVAGVHEFNL